MAGRSFTIPTYFTAVDRFSAPVKVMINTLDRFASKADSVVSRQERVFRKLTPAIGEAQKQMLSMVGTAAVVGAAFAGGRFSVNAIMDYETAIANLSAITGTSGAALEKFKIKIKDVATVTKSSSIDVANAFTMVGNNAPMLLKDADALAEVTKQSIILARASKMDLAASADYLTKIMNQFNTPAKEAGKTIDLLAGGMVIGSTDINKISEAMLIFGGTAGAAGVKLNESVTAIEAVSDKVTDMSRLGTQLRNIFDRMSRASVLDKTALTSLRRAHVDMGILESKTAPLIDKLKELQKLQSIKGGLANVFNPENLQTLIPLLDSIPKYEDMLSKLNAEVAKGGIAQEMANKNNATLAAMVDQLKNKFVTWITTSQQAAESIDIAKKAVGFLADNLADIFRITGLVVGVFVTWWTVLKLLRLGIIATQIIAKAFFLVDMIKYIASTQGITFATAAWGVAQESLNAAFIANPIGLVIIAVAALTAGIYSLINAQNELNAATKRGWEKSKVEQINKQREAVDSLTNSYRKNGDTQEEARRRAVQHESVTNDLRIANLRLKIIQEQSRIGTDMEHRKVSGIEFFQKSKEIEQLKFALNIAETNKKENQLYNPNQIAANQMTQTINNNNNSNKNVTVTVKAAEGTSATVSGEGISDITPFIGSTMVNR